MPKLLSATNVINTYNNRHDTQHNDSLCWVSLSFVILSVAASSGNPNWNGRISTVDLVLTSSDRLLFILKLSYFFTKPPILMRRLIVLFPGLFYSCNRVFSCSEHWKWMRPGACTINILRSWMTTPELSETVPQFGASL
jgi:hypothetical protein